MLLPVPRERSIHPACHLEQFLKHNFWSLQQSNRCTPPSKLPMALQSCLCCGMNPSLQSSPTPTAQTLQQARPRVWREQPPPLTNTKHTYRKPALFFSEVIVKSLKFSRHWWHTPGNSDFGGAQGFLDLALSPYNFFSFLQVQDPFFLHSHVRVLLYEDVFLKQSGWWQNDLPLLSLVTPALGHGRFVHLSSAQLNHDSAHQAYFS